MYKKSLFIFRRDLRIEDNLGLIAAHKSSKQVIPVFIFDPRQCSQKNKYLSQPGLQFLIQALQDLANQIALKGGRLSILQGVAEEVCQELVKKYDIDAIFFNKDYTPFSKKRDEAIAHICKKLGIVCLSLDDALLTAPGSIKNNSGNPYQVFSSFVKKVLQQDLMRPTLFRTWNFASLGITHQAMSTTEMKNLVDPLQDIAVIGNRLAGLKLLKKATTLQAYDQQRDFPAQEYSSHLSAYNKFGLLSIREVFHTLKEKLGDASPLLVQLVWRDFFYHIAHHFPHVFQGAFKQQYDKIVWNKSDNLFQAWCQGKTGFPIVDAGMRQLNRTGFMHNRVRMITASFLVKDLHLDWRWGERYFAQHLVDYDPAVNNGSWQWVAGTGCDAAPYFRVFNPWLQQKKFDAECEYVRRWVPELKFVATKDIHAYFKNNLVVKNYPRPIVDHSVVSKQAITLYKV